MVLQEFRFPRISLKAVNSEQSPDDSEKVNKLLKTLQRRGYNDIRTLNVSASFDPKASRMTLDILFTF